MARAKPVPAADEPTDVELGVLKEVIGFRIRRIQNHLSRSFYQRIGRPDVKPGVFSALSMIASNPGLSQTTLAREIGFDKATVVVLLDNMESLGWAERQRSATDRRRHSLSITPAGQKALDGLLAAAIANEAAIHGALTAEEHAELYRLLDKVYVACFRDEPDA